MCTVQTVVRPGPAWTHVAGPHLMGSAFADSAILRQERLLIAPVLYMYRLLTYRLHFIRCNRQPRNALKYASRCAQSVLVPFYKFIYIICMNLGLYGGIWNESTAASKDYCPLTIVDLGVLIIGLQPSTTLQPRDQ